MAIDTPATIAIIGAGPIGLEAALYARYLGYQVLLFERETVASAVRSWGHLPMVMPFASCVSKLGLAALHAQNPAWRPPAIGAVVTGDAWRKEYLLPLANSDLIVDCLQEQTEVIAVRREIVPPAVAEAENDDVHSDDEEGEEEAFDGDEEYDVAAHSGFRLTVRNTNTGTQSEVIAHVVIDASGVAARWGRLSGTETPLPGELAAADRIQVGLPDIRGGQRAKFAGRKTLLVGDGMFALANLTALIERINADPQTSVVWITPSHDAQNANGTNQPGQSPGPTAGARPGDGSKLAAVVADLAPHLQHWPGASLTALSIDDGGTVRVQFTGAPQTEMAFDQIINNGPFQSGEPFFWGLSPQTPPANYQTTSAPEKSVDFAARHVETIYAQIARDLVTGEPNFYILGSKRRGKRAAELTVREGLDQICALFTILGDRPNLNLYATMDKLLP